MCRQFLYGFTPLFVAAGKGDLKMIRFLLDKGADLNIKGLQNGICTPLDYAIGREHMSGVKPEKGRREVIELFLQKSA